MSAPANDQYSTDINVTVEYIGDSQLPELQLRPSANYSQDFTYLSAGPGWRSPQIAPSDSGSDYSDAGSPYSSPHLRTSEELAEKSTDFLDTGLEARIPNLSLLTDIYPLQNSAATRSSPSLLFPDSPASSNYFSPADPLLPFPPSPLSSSHTSLYGSGHSETSSPVKLSPYLPAYSPHDTPSSPYSFTSSPALDTLYLTPGPFDSAYTISSPPSPSPSYHPPSPLHLPKLSLSVMPDVTDVIAEVAESQSSVDAESVRHRLLETLSPGGDLATGDLKTLFSKGAKSSVSTDAGRAASELRRKHPARFSCQFTGCRSTFTRKLGLENHQKSHLGITDQECKFCSKRFPNSLPRHMKRCKDNPNRITTKKPRKAASAVEPGTMR